MARNKVIHIITRFDKGGSAENTFLTVVGLDRERYEVVLVRGVALESAMDAAKARAVERNLEEARQAGVRIVTVPALVRDIHPLKDLAAFCRLLQILREERPAIVHTHTSKAGILGRWAAWLARVPIVVHTPHGHVFWGYFSRLATVLFVLAEKITSAVTDKIIVLTEQEKKDNIVRRIAPESKFAIIHSGVALARFAGAAGDAAEAKKELGIPADAFVVGTVGRLTRIKGQKYLLAAAQKTLARTPGAYFVLLGDGELAVDLRAQVASYGIAGNVRFVGWRDDVSKIMSAFDVFVLPSLNEGMGKVLVEAMALGKPIIASAAGGITDLIVPGENGILVPCADADAIAQSIELMRADPALRIRMGARGRQMAVNYGAELMVRKIDSLYVELLACLP